MYTKIQILRRIFRQAVNKTTWNDVSSLIAINIYTKRKKRGKLLKGKARSFQVLCRPFVKSLDEFVRHEVLVVPDLKKNQIRSDGLRQTVRFHGYSRAIDTHLSFPYKSQFRILKEFRSGCFGKQRFKVDSRVLPHLVEGKMVSQLLDVFFCQIFVKKLGCFANGPNLILKQKESKKWIVLLMCTQVLGRE